MLKVKLMPLKAKHYLLAAIGVVLLVWAWVFCGILNKYAEDQVDQKEVLRLAVVVLGYPEVVQNAFKEYTNDDVLTKSEYGDIVAMMKAYDDQLAKTKTSKTPQTKLEQAEANLAAYDRVGYMVFPENQRDKVRSILVDNINKIKR